MGQAGDSGRLPGMTNTPKPRKAAASEPGSKLHIDSFVTDLTGRRQGIVTRTYGSQEFRVDWADGERTVEERGALLSRYTTETPTPKPQKKTWRRLVPTTEAAQ